MKEAQNPLNPFVCLCKLSVFVFCAGFQNFKAVITNVYIRLNTLLNNVHAYNKSLCVNRLTTQEIVSPNPYGSIKKLTKGDLEILSAVDEVIRPAVKIMREHSFSTFESCQGGKGHPFTEPTIRFNGTEFDLITAYELCYHYKLNVTCVRRVYVKNPVYNNKWEEITENWTRPFNEIVFHKNSERRTIFRRH